METTGIAGGIAGTYVSAGEAALRRGLIENARKRLAHAEEQHQWLVSKIKPKNRGFADTHRKAINLALTVMERLAHDLPSDSFLAIHEILMEVLDMVADAFGGAIGWQGGKAGTGRNGGHGKIEKNPEANAKAAAKAQVKELWKLWQADPARYKSKAEFARDMIAKYPEYLTSQKVIEDWCRAWEKVKS